MASFSTIFPRAVHVMPLHAIGGILKHRALLGKSTLVHHTDAAVRVTTSQTDLALGLTDYVHFYLLHSNSKWENIPILAAQLLNGSGAPFPHAAIEMSTRELSDEECTVCLWNVAVSRPKVDDHCEGGNWARGTAATRVLQVWRLFKQQEPNIRAAGRLTGRPERTNGRDE